MSASSAGSHRSDRGAASSGGGSVPPVWRCVLYIVCWPAAAVLLLELASLFVGPLDRSFRGSGENAIVFVGVASECVAAVSVALLFRRFMDRQPLDSLGFTFRVRWVRLFAIGVLLGAGMQSLVLTLETALGFAHAAPPRWASTEFASLAYVIPLLLLGAIAEEIPIRGYLFQNLSEAWGTKSALVATSLLFAALHLFNPGVHADLGMTMAGIAAAGALFCLSVILTRSLWLALGCHFAWNLFEGPVFGFPISGLSFGNAHILNQTVSGPQWFTGGSFGPEAGASSLIALAAGAAVLFALHRRGLIAG